MRHVAQLIEVGRSAAHVLRNEETWIHRRVETLTFPIPDEPVYRRRISIDFSIPSGLASIDGGIEGGRPPRYYVPLSILQKWPPLDRLDLLGEDGKPIPFLTGRQNQALDSAALVQMADDIAVDTPLTEDEKRQVAKIALSRDSGAIEAFSAVCPSLATSPEGTVSEAIEALRGDEAFVGLAQTLCLHTILWLRTEGEAEDREIVKFAYDIPWDHSVARLGLASFGLAPFVFEFDTPHVSATGSYHLNMTTPSPLRAVGAELVLFEASEASEEIDPTQPIDPAKVRHKATPDHPVKLDYDGFEAYADVRGPRAKFYVSGERRGLAGRVYVSVRLDIGGFLRSACLSAILIAAIMGCFAAAHHRVALNSNAAAAVLLVAPALLAYLLRPSEHVLVGGLLAGLRRVAILGGVWPLIAATLVVVLTDEVALQWSLTGLGIAELFTAAALALPLRQH